MDTENHTLLGSLRRRRIGGKVEKGHFLHIRCRRRLSKKGMVFSVHRTSGLTKGANLLDA